jgi:hypothetical protein
MTIIRSLLPLAVVISQTLAHSTDSAAEPAPLANRPSFRDLNTPREFPEITSRQEWQARAKEIREQVLVSCGLWPIPQKAPLNAHVFGRIERDGYSVEKVYLQTFPRFYLGGNLYRPLGKDKGPFPAILNPHGHWNEGRFADTKDGSIAARCISFARQGMIAFSYDMVGFNDTRFADAPTNRPFYEVHRQFATNRADLLWNISLMGLQTWNSIRALDFLASLPDADPKRLACTGESGGGTQTYMLGAVDERLAAQAPVVMVSHVMQGGCLCENAPGLRVEYSNMEIAAAAAPRPQILVAATGDWTKDTPSVEGPALAHIYELLGAPEKLRYVQFDFGHNYNQTSREAVYEWFGKWLLKSASPALLKESPYQKEPNPDLRVFAAGQFPADALTQAQLLQYLRKQHRDELAELAPHDQSGLKRFKETMFPAWRHTLQVRWPRARTQVQTDDLKTAGDLTTASVIIQRLGEASGIRAAYLAPASILTEPRPKLVVMCNESASGGDDATDGSLPRRLIERGLAILQIQHFSAEVAVDQFANFYSTYNRTKLQQRVQDLLTVCSGAGSVEPRKSASFRVVLYGKGSAGIWALEAAPAADAVIADCAGLEGDEEQAWLAPDYFCPGILSLDGIEVGGMLAAPHPLLLHAVGTDVVSVGIRAAFKASKSEQKLVIDPEPLAEEKILAWAVNL